MADETAAIFSTGSPGCPSRSTAAAPAALLPLLQNNYAQAAVIAANDPRLVAEHVVYDSPKGKINGYLVRPTEKGKRPAIIVIQENRGLDPHVGTRQPRRLAVRAFWPSLPTYCPCLAAHRLDEDEARDL